jgi:ABC-type branched-subunit amino acid transport system substrate-binding protein
MVAGAQTESPGVSPTEIVFGTHAPLRGPAARYAAAARAANAYFRWVNENGGVNGRSIRLIVRDDQGDTGTGERVIRDLVRHDRVLAVIGGLGDRPHASAVDFLNNQEVPDLFVLGGSLLWSRPARRWTVALTPSYRQEGALLAQIAQKEFAGRRLGIYAQVGELGIESAQGFRNALRGRLNIVAEARQSVTEGDPTQAINDLRGAGAQVVAVFAVPGMAVRFLAAANKAGWSPPVLLASAAAVPELIERAGRGNAEGAVSLTYLPLADDARDDRVARHRDLLKTYAPGLAADAMTLTGQAVAELTVEAVRRAGATPTRASLMKAAESLENWNGNGQVLAPMVALSAQDHQALHGARRVTVRNGRWVAGGDWLLAPPLDP